MAEVDLGFERIVLDGIGRLLVDDHDLAAAARAVDRLSGRADEFPGVLLKHKVATIAAKNLELLVSRDLVESAAASALEHALSPEVDRANQHRDMLEEQVREVALATVDADLAWDDVIILKGFSNGRFYPSPYRRWMRDIDLFTESWTDAHRLVEQLLRRGYEFDRSESPWVKADDGNGQGLYGQVFLVRPTGEHVARVDVHFGTYSIGFAGYLQTSLRDLSTTMTLGAGTVRVLRPEGCVLLAQAHALSDGYVSIKDVNDFVAIAVSGESVDWSRVAVELRSHELTPQAKLLALHCSALYDNAHVRVAADSLARATSSRRRSTSRVHDRDWNHRARVNASFAFRWARRVRGQRLAGSAWAALLCYCFYVRRLSLAVRRRTAVEHLLHFIMPKPALREWRLRPDACTLLIDAGVVQALVDGPPLTTVHAAQAVPVAEGIEVLIAGSRDFVRMNGRTYVPTLDLLIEPDCAASVPGG